MRRPPSRREADLLDPRAAQGLDVAGAVAASIVGEGPRRSAEACHVVVDGLDGKPRIDQLLAIDGSSRQHESSMHRTVRSGGTMLGLTFFCSDMRLTRYWLSSR